MPRDRRINSYQQELQDQQAAIMRQRSGLTDANDTEASLPFGISLPTNQDEDYYSNHRNFQPGTDKYYEALNFNPKNNYVRQEDGSWINKPINVFTENEEYWRWADENPDDSPIPHADNPYELYIPDPDDLGLGSGGQGVPRPTQHQRPPIETNYLPGEGIELGGIEDPRFDMSGGPGWDQTAPPGPPGGWDSPPPGSISGPSREFSPHGETIGQFSAPRTYGGLPRSTGPWGAAGGWYNQAALASALRGQ